MEAPFAVAPQHDRQYIPQPEASLGNGDLGDRNWESNNKSGARRANIVARKARRTGLDMTNREEGHAISTFGIWNRLQ